MDLQNISTIHIKSIDPFSITSLLKNVRLYLKDLFIIYNFKSKLVNYL